MWRSYTWAFYYSKESLVSTFGKRNISFWLWSLFYCFCLISYWMLSLPIPSPFQGLTKEWERSLFKPETAYYMVMPWNSFQCNAKAIYECDLNLHIIRSRLTIWGTLKRNLEQEQIYHSIKFQLSTYDATGVLLMTNWMWSN